MDWLATMTVPQDGLKAAIGTDLGNTAVEDTRPLLKGPRSHLETIVFHAAFRAEQTGLDIPLDGTSIISYCIGCLPSSRGSITLGYNDPTAPPIIDPKYYATEADRYVLREGWRTMSRLMFEIPEGKDLVVDEILPGGHR